MSQVTVSNQLLRAMKPAGFAALLPHLELVELPRRMNLAQPKLAPKEIYFLESGIAVAVGNLAANRQELGLFGRDGAGCVSVLLGSHVAPYGISMVLPGRGLRIRADALYSIFQENQNVREVILRFIQAVHVQVTQTALANTQMNVEQRLMRILLMIHDRLDGDYIPMTHEMLADLLGVFRTGITASLRALERTGLIVMSRSQILILNRAELEQRSSPLYGHAEAEYRVLISDFQDR